MCAYARYLAETSAIIIRDQERPRYAKNTPYIWAAGKTRGETIQPIEELLGDLQIRFDYLQKSS